jgi:hypothetical protein
MEAAFSNLNNLPSQTDYQWDHYIRFEEEQTVLRVGAVSSLI